MSSFFNWLENRIADYEVARQRGLKAYDTRLQRAAVNRNEGAEPIFSEKSGRLHAPFDGYVWVWCEGDSEFEAAYLAGQYLPFPKERESIALGDFGEQTKFDSRDCQRLRVTRVRRQARQANALRDCFSMPS